MTDENTTQNSVHGVEVIRAALDDMPRSPGVYRMLNAQGDVLYVGKAKHLRNRVSNYASPSNLTYRIMRMVEQTASVEIVTTHTEAEALLLEANMIKKLQPRYNILLRDDKSFPYIIVTGDHDFPRVKKHRGAQKQKGEYFGPFASAGAVNKTIAQLQRAFLLRPCSDSIFNNRTRPCLQYQIKRCSAPCVDYISKQDYAGLVDQAKAFLSGKSREIQARLVEQMQAHSDAMEFEKAARLRDRVRALTQVQQDQGMRVAGLDDADAIALYKQDGQSCIQVFFFRKGNHFGNQSYFPKHSAEASEAEILSAFLSQFYQTHTPPKEILLSHPIEEEEVLSQALSMDTPYTVHFFVPKRGDKREVIQQALRNAEAALLRRQSERMADAALLEGVAKLFHLSEAPTRIEVYDNSHISGTHALGAMVVATPEGLDKKSYRQFNIRDEALEPGDDYGMMREVFTRRFKRLQKDDPERTQGQWPDLVLIDGGLGQLNAVREVFEELGVDDLCYVAIAKGPDRNAGREQFFMPDKAPFQLPVDDPVLHYLQRLRDESHRFAIGAHRRKRGKAISTSELDAIPGIGATRKRALLHHFGSRKQVERATLAELEKVPGISKKTAQIIYDHFHS